MDEVEELLPGWYRQQTDPTHLRWWDGHAWTDDVLPAEVLDDDALEAELEDQIRAPVDDDAPIEVRPRRREPLRPEGAEPPLREAPDVTLAEQARRFAGTFGDDVPRPDRRPRDPSADPRRRPQPQASIRIPDEPRTPPGSGARRPPAPGPRRPPDPGEVRRDARRPPPRAGQPGQHGPARRPPARSQRGQHAARPAPPSGRLAFRIAMVAAVAVLGYLLVRPFLEDPPSARTIRGDGPEVPVADEQGFINGHPPLADAVLTLRELPTGWMTQAEVAAVRFCGGRNPHSVIVPQEEHRASFTKGTSGPFLAQTAVRFLDAREADAFFDLVATTYETCRAYEEGGARVVLEPVDFPKLGDDTFAARVSGESAGVLLDGYYVWVRVDDRLISLSSVAFSEDADIALVERLAEALIRRF